jgi:hypothetical protein
VCDAFQIAKSHQLPHSKSNSSSSHPLELIYSDVWGYAPKFVGGKQYYVSFIDDYNKFSWIYPLKFKSKVFSNLLNSKYLWSVSLTGRLSLSKRTRAGNTKSHIASSPKLASLIMFLCPYAHQQNGSAEQKHHHIMEVGLSLLAHVSMPLKYWDDVFLAAVYLINRTPSKVLNYETPL